SEVWTETTLFVRPAMRAVSRVTVMRPSPPAGTSRADATPTVHPQLLFTWSMRRVSEPRFARRKTCSTFVPCSTVPKSHVCSGTTTRPPASAPARAASAAPSRMPAKPIAVRPSPIAERFIYSRVPRRATRVRRSVHADALARLVRGHARAAAVRVGSAADVLVVAARARRLALGDLAEPDAGRGR